MFVMCAATKIRLNYCVVQKQNYSCVTRASKAKYTYLHNKRKKMIIFPQNVQGAEGSGPGQESLRNRPIQTFGAPDPPAEEPAALADREEERNHGCHQKRPG